MAVNAAKMIRALNEASGYRGSSYVGAYEYASDDLTACTYEMNAGILQETIDYMNMRDRQENEILEAAMMYPSRLREIDEGALATIKDKIKKFFDKIIAFIKGIITKIQAQFYKMTEQYGKWLKTMRKPVEDAGKRDGAGKFKYTMYNFDEAFITKGMLSGIETGMNEMFVVAKNATADDIKSWVADAISSSGADDYSDTTRDLATNKRDANDPGYEAREKAVSDYSKATIDKLEAEQKKVEDAYKQFEKDFPSEFGKCFSGVSGSSWDSVWTSIEKKAHGGSSEKKEVVVGNNAKHYLDVIEKTKDTISDLKDKYQKHMDDLSAYRDKIDDNFKLEEVKDMPGPLETAYSAYVRAECDFLTKEVSAYENALSTAKDKNTKYVQEMAQAYMSAMQAFAGYKPEKKD